MRDSFDRGINKYCVTVCYCVTLVEESLKLTGTLPQVLTCLIRHGCLMQNIFINMQQQPLIRLRAGGRLITELYNVRLAVWRHARGVTRSTPQAHPSTHPKKFRDDRSRNDGA